MYLNLIKILAPTAFAFLFGILITPLATHFFYKYKMWKKYSRDINVNNSNFTKVHSGKAELNTPRVGGVIIWFATLSTVLVFYFISVLFPSVGTEKMNFLSRNQTLIPVFTLLIGALIGLWDDLIQIFGNGRFAQDDKVWRFWKIGLAAFLSFLIGLWFFYKLDITSIHIPFAGDLYIGILVIPFFVLIALATFSSGVIDGIDGLSGGVLTSIFSSYAVIAYANNQIDIAAFSGVIAGATLAFLWFNVPPARFYMGETGIMALTITLATIAFLTDSVLVLPIVGFPLVITSGSVILQLISKKLRNGKRIFRLAPLHHHFEALGWPSYKVTMRFWILSVMCAIIGAILAIIS